MGLPPGLTKSTLDAADAESLSRFGMSVGSLVMEERLCEQSAKLHAASRARADDGLLHRLWPWSEFNRLGRMQTVARAQAKQWEARLREVVEAVAERTGER